jgi:hypothetical protein
MVERRVEAYCEECGAPGVSEDGRMAVVFHAAGCSARPLSQGHDRCQHVGCWAVLHPERAARGAKTCDARCRAAAWKARTGYGRPGGRSAAVVVSEGRSHASGGGARPASSGLQVSYRKAVAVVTDLLACEAGFDSGEAGELAEYWLRSALSEAQRARLDARS